MHYSYLLISLYTYFNILQNDIEFFHHKILTSPSIVAHQRENIWLVLDVNGFLVRLARCDNINTTKAFESQHSPMISEEMVPLFFPYGTLIPRK